MNNHPQPRTAFVAAALLSLYLIWGSTYFAIRIGLDGFAPFTLASVRFLLAGSALYLGLRWRGARNPDALQWRNAAVTGVLLLGLGNGLVCYAEQSVGSGLAAVAIASVPLFAALFSVLFGDWPRRGEWAAVLVGLAGVVLLNLGGDLRSSPAGAAALLLAAATWAMGSVWSRRQPLPAGAMNTAVQMLAGGLALALMAAVTGEHWHARPGVPALLAMVYLVVFGSLVGFSAYLWLLRNVRPVLATSYAYVNPPVAVLLGVALGGERIGAMDLAGMAVILAAVVMLTLGRVAPSR